jgi:hypothetical protein
MTVLDTILPILPRKKTARMVSVEKRVTFQSILTLSQKENFLVYAPSYIRIDIHIGKNRQM